MPVLRRAAGLAMLWAACVLPSTAAGPGDLKRKDIDLKKLAKDFDDEGEDGLLWESKRRRHPPSVEPKAEDLAASLGLEGLPPAPPGSDLDKILRNANRGSKGPMPNFDMSKIMGGLGGGGGFGGNAMKTISAVFRDGVCPVKDEKCANGVARKFSHLLATGGITETMSNALDPWNKVIYVFQGAKIMQMPQVRAFLLIQPEVGKVTEDGHDYYPDDVEPPSPEEIAAEKAEKERVKAEKRAAADRAEQRRLDRKKMHKKKSRRKVDLDADGLEEAEL